MTSDITRNIIIDLLPAYLAAEASDETKRLVEEFAKSDAQIARLIQSGGNGLPKVAVPESELRTLLRTRRRIRKQGWHMGLAIFLTMLAISFRFDSEQGIFWTWEHFPVLCIASAILAVVFWLAYFEGRRRLKQATGL